VKINQVHDNVIRLSLFTFSLAGNAKVWLQSFPKNNLDEWDDQVQKFLQNFFPQSKVNYNQGRQEILAFQQDYEETLSQT